MFRVEAVGPAGVVYGVDRELRLTFPDRATKFESEEEAELYCREFACRTTQKLIVHVEEVEE